MNIYLLVSFLSMVVCLVIGDVVYHKNKQSLSNRLFALFSLLIAYLIFTQEFMGRQAVDRETALFWSKVSALWIFAIPVFVHFVFVFTKNDKILKKSWTYGALYLPALFFAFIQFTTELIGRLEKGNWGYTIYNAPSDTRLYRLFLIWAYIPVILSITLLVKCYFQTTDKLQKHQIRFIFIGVSIGGFFGSLETILESFGTEIIALDSLEMTFFNLCMGYAIWKYQLFVIDPATAAENIITTMPDSLLLIDLEGKVVQTNPSLINLLKFDEREIVGKVMTTLFTEKEFAEVILAKLQKGNPVINHEVELHTAFGQGVPVLISGSIVKDKKGKTVGTVYVIRDITERKQNEAILQNYTEKLKQSNHELQEFVYIASHDLQEPLRKIMVFGDWLKEKAKGLNEQERDYLAQMQNAAERMRILISDLLIYSRVAFNKQTSIANDLRIILQEVLIALAIAIGQTKGTVTTVELPVVESDPAQMRQLFYNLISNSLKYHQPGKPPEVIISVRIFKERRRDFAEICVADNGIGIEPANYERVFRIFQRLHSRDEYEGTGIGLAVCKKIVENHQGAIRVESTLGAGSRFFITLPVKQDE